MKIGIIGAGKVGTTLGKYLKEAGAGITGYYSRTKESADEAATFTGTTSYETLQELVEAGDTVFVTTPDDAIEGVWQQLRQLDIQKDIICHFSGSLSSHVFSGIEESDAYGISIHPMYAFSDKFTSYQEFHTAYLTMEGDSYALEQMKPFWEKLGHTVLTLRAEDKIKYHAAAALASNAMVGLFQTSLELLEECGFDRESSRHLLTPLVQGNVDAMLKKGCEAALTGPVERGDKKTVQKHLQALRGGGAEEIYRSLGEKLVSLAVSKNPDRDYSQMQELFRKESD